MNEKRLWEQVEKRRKSLKRSLDGGVPPNTREYLSELGFVEEACGKDFEEDAVNYIVKQIDALAVAYPGGSGYRGVSADDSYKEEATNIPVDLNLGKYKRARVLAELQVREANRNSNVQHLRNVFQGYGSLPPEELQKITESLTDIPDAPPEKERDEEQGKPAMLFLYVLREVRDQLAEEYGWTKHAAAWFVLTGEAPHVDPLRASCKVTNNRSWFDAPIVSTITIEALSWVSPNEVEKAYRSIQETILGQRYQPITPKRLEVLRFVEEETDTNGERPPYELLRKMWNKKYPDWSYASYRSFRKAHVDTRTKLLSKPTVQAQLRIAPGVTAKLSSSTYVQ